MNLKILLICLAVIVACFIAVSLFDIVVAVVNLRFYSTAAFITLFGVGGVFAAFLANSYALTGTKKTTAERWTVLITIFAAAFAFFFPLAAIEGGEYAPAFKAYGITLALTCLIIWKTKMD
jgi:hypothetical protein